MLSDRTILGSLEMAVQKAGSEPQIRFLGAGQHSPNELWDSAGRTAAVFQHLGVKPGDRVCYLISNRVEFLWMYFGVAYAGAVSVPLNTAIHGPILQHMLSTADPSLIVTDSEFLGAVSEAAANSGIQCPVLTVDGPSAAGGDGVLADMVASADPGSPSVVEPSDLGSILFTSGTTGPSKGVMQSHNMSVAFSEAANSYVGIGPEDTAFNCLPLFHANSLLVSLIPALRNGGRACFAERFSARRFWADVRECDATVISLLGSMVPILWNQPEEEDDADNPVRVALTVPTPNEQLRPFEERFGLRITALYGMTDVGLPIGVPAGQKAKPGSCGVVHPDWECIVADEYDEEVPDGTPGELLVRPKRPFTVLSGYFGNPEATVQTWRNLWFHTGDVLVRDEDGWYTYVDRKKDAIRRFGENISSFEVEMVLQGHPAVQEVAVYAVPADLVEDEVMAAVVLEPGFETTAAELAAYCEETLPYFAVPRFIEIRNDLPRTQTAKVQKQVLRDEGVTPSTWDGGARGRRALEQRDAQK